MGEGPAEPNTQQARIRVERHCSPVVNYEVETDDLHDAPKDLREGLTDKVKVTGGRNQRRDNQASQKLRKKVRGGGEGDQPQRAGLVRHFRRLVDSVDRSEAADAAGEKVEERHRGEVEGLLPHNLRRSAPGLSTLCRSWPAKNSASGLLLSRPGCTLGESKSAAHSQQEVSEPRARSGFRSSCIR